MALARKNRLALSVVACLVAALIIGYAGRVAWLFMGATEGDVPSASSLPLPAGSQIVNVSTDCASGGCWSLFDVRAPDGSTPEDLAHELGADPQAKITGNLLDPRTIWLWAEQEGDLLSIRADYWSFEWGP